MTCGRQIRRVVQLDFNMRTSGLLATILDQMRHGSLDDKTWHALKRDRSKDLSPTFSTLPRMDR